ncbi:MAG TPA: flagellar biosynthetic protein FliR [Azospirillaceae bacterium]|nr:flagellar biosynthetic protein FliR [Azospirillaceae bacterium]
MLQALITGQLFAFLLVFTRVGAAFLVLPGVGETFVSARIRLLLALTTALVVTPVARPLLPAQPTEPALLTLLITAEVMVGIFIGTIARTMLAAMETAGSIISNAVGLSAAQSFNPAMAAPGNAVSALLGIVAILLIFAADLHHLMIMAVVGSYDVFRPGMQLPVGDFSQHLTRVFSESFLVGLQLSAPFVVIGLVFNLGLGLVARLVPQIQIFFIGIPIQIGGGLLLLAAGMTALMLFWLAAFQAQLVGLLGG